MSERLNLFKKIQNVSNHIKNIEKDMSVGTGSYSYKAVGDQQVVLRVKEAETMEKIISIPIKQEIISSEVLRANKNGKDTITFVDNIKMTVKIIDIENPSDFIEIESFGKGIDSGDKGFGKASTYARKYALLNAYKIATGEDPDKDKSPTYESTTIDEKKVSVFNELKADVDTECAVLEHFGHASMEDLTQDQIKLTYNRFKKQGKI